MRLLGNFFEFLAIFNNPSTSCYLIFSFTLFFFQKDPESLKEFEFNKIEWFDLYLDKSFLGTDIVTISQEEGIMEDLIYKKLGYMRLADIEKIELYLDKCLYAKSRYESITGLQEPSKAHIFSFKDSFVKGLSKQPILMLPYDKIEYYDVYADNCLYSNSVFESITGISDSSYLLRTNYSNFYNVKMQKFSQVDWWDHYSEWCSYKYSYFWKTVYDREIKEFNDWSDRRLRFSQEKKRKDGVYFYIAEPKTKAQAKRERVYCTIALIFYLWFGVTGMDYFESLFED